MGLFNRKKVSKFKDYSLNEAISLLKLPKYKGFSVVELEDSDRYKIVPEKEARQHIENIKEVKRVDRAFANRISNNGEYGKLGSSQSNVQTSRDIQITRNSQTLKDGDYQNAKGYNSVDWSR